MKVLIGRGCRSDYPISDPIIKRLKNQDWCKYQTIDLIPADFLESYKKVQELFNKEKFDLILCCGDRIEMTALAVCAFHNHQKIGHVGAGIIDYSRVLFDDRNRHVITLYSDILFCEDRASCRRAFNFWLDDGRIKKWDWENLEEHNVYDVGNFYEIDDLEVDESLVPDELYDLVLINPEPRGRSELELFKEADMITKQFYRKSIWIPSNPDQEEFLIGKVNFDYPTLPRSQYLGLLQNCTRFISNSSSIHYEAFPLGLKEEQIVFIGSRNKNRSTPKKLETGASDKIVNILKKWWQNEQL